MPDLSSDIATQAVEPLSSSADGQSATGRSVEELIRADQYLAGKSAAAKRRRGVMFGVFRTPGASGLCPTSQDFARNCNGGC